MNKRYQIYALADDDVKVLKETDSVGKAIECFFKNQKKYQLCVAILADTYHDAKLLIEFASARHDFIEECYEKYEKIPYKKEFIIGESDRCANVGKYDKDGLFMDQVYPFSLG